MTRRKSRQFNFSFHVKMNHIEWRRSQVEVTVFTCLEEHSFLFLMALTLSKLPRTAIVTVKKYSAIFFIAYIVMK